MPDLSTIREEVQARLRELEGLIAPLSAERDELQGVADKFTSNGAARGSAPTNRGRRAGARKAAAGKSTPAKSPGTPRRSRRVSGGGRAAQAIGLIAAHPGMTVPEMAKAMGIGSNYLYRVLPQLEKDGKVTKQGKGYHPASDGTQG